jgi:phosphopantothenoylcysteine decarboxylase/phosphopantothenate--cysteine ligase
VTDLPARRVLLGVSGSSGALSVPSIVAWLRAVARVEQVRVVMTESAASFVAPAGLEIASGNPVLVGSPPPTADVPHVTLTEWADAFVVVPATANVIAKAAHGIADDLLSTAVLASPIPVVFAASMNATMWANPALRRNVRQVEEDGHHVVPPALGFRLSTATMELGSMPPVEELFDVVARHLRHDRAARATRAGEETA